MSIKRRIEKVEKKIGGDTAEIRTFADLVNHTTKFICFEDISKSKQQGKL
jgi:hypothetical protein